MPIQIIDNFDLRAPKAIDNRFVVGTGQFYTTRDSIDYKYTGLRVWDIDLGSPFVWTGVTWSNESSSGITGTGTVGTIPKFIGTSNNIGNSVIVESSSNIGIGGAPSTSKLKVYGNVESTSTFIGLAWNGSTGLTNINATNISVGTMNISRLQYGTASQVLLGGASTAIWTNLSLITAGNSTNVTVTNEYTSTAEHYLAFVSTTSGNTGIKVSNVSLIGGGPASTAGIRFKPSTLQILMPPYWQSPVPPTLPLITKYDSTNPVYSFQGDTDTGIYSPGPNQVAVSTNGTGRLSVNDTNVAITNELSLPSGSFSDPSVYFTSSQNTGLYRPGVNQIGITINSSRAFEINSSKNIIIYSPDASNNLNLSVSNLGEMILNNVLSTSSYSFKINSLEKMNISSSGISIISSTPIENWNVTSLTADRWVTDFSGSTSVSSFDLPSTTYDRIVYGYHGSTGVAQVYIYVETSTGTFELLGISSPNGYSGCNAIVPAGKKFRLYMDAVSGTSTVSFKIYKFGK